MRKSCIMTGLVSFALALATSLPASAQTSTTTPAPEASPQSQTAPQRQPAPSQTAPSGDAAQGRAPAQSQHNDNPLNLTEEQKAKLQPIIADENKQMDAVRSDTSLTTDQKIQKSTQIRSTASPRT